MPEGPNISRRKPPSALRQKEQRNRAGRRKKSGSASVVLPIRSQDRMNDRAVRKMSQKELRENSRKTRKR